MGVYLKENNVKVKDGIDVNSTIQDMEKKIISIYAKGMATTDIKSHMKDLYGIDISDSTISGITDKILLIIKKWQECPQDYEQILERTALLDMPEI